MINNSEDELIDIDTMLSYAGDFGRYQIILMILFSIINIFSGFHYFGQTFISLTPEYKCKLTEYEKINNNNLTIKSCFKIINQPLNQTYKVPCTNGWDYNNTYGFVSIVEELNWVCNDDWKPAIGQSVFFIGSCIGSLLFGVLADRIGRLHVLVGANMLAFFGNSTTILCDNVVVFSVCRFIAGCATDTNFVMMYIIVMEYIRPSMRTLGLNLCIGVFYCISCIIVPWVAVTLKNWKLFLLVIAMPHLSVLGFYYLVPESAQWLISKGRIEEAIKCFKRIAKINGRIINESSIDNLRKYCNRHVKTTTTSGSGEDTGEEAKKHDNLWGLLRTPKLRRKTFILIFKSMVMTLCYDAISRNVNGLGYSPFVIFSITSSTILPACLIILAIQDKIGRKALASSTLLISGIFSIFSGIIQSINTTGTTLIICLSIISRLSINIAYNSGHQYAVELIPTVVRGQGISAIHVAGYAASFFSPQILYLKTLWQPTPYIILGVLLILGALACLFLPETLNKTLPVTLNDGENFGEDEGIFEFACFKAKTESTITLTTKNNIKYS